MGDTAQAEAEGKERKGIEKMTWGGHGAKKGLKGVRGGRCG
jgi:hypothetical protein